MPFSVLLFCWGFLGVHCISSHLWTVPAGPWLLPSEKGAQRGHVWFQYLFWPGPIICFLCFSLIVVLKWPLTRCIARSSFWAASRPLPDRWIFGCLYQTFWWLLKKSTQPNSTFANAARNKLTQISQNPWSLSISLPYLKFSLDPFLQKGSSLQVENLFVCLSVCLSSL